MKNYTGLNLGKPERFSTQIRPEIEKLLREMADYYGVSIAQIIEDGILLFAGEFYIEPPPEMFFSGPGGGIGVALDYLKERGAK